MRRGSVMVGFRGVRRDAGFTVVELVAASVILLIVVVGVLGALQYAVAASQTSGVRDHALAIGNQYIEQARNLPYDQVGLVSGDPNGVLAASVTVTATGPVSSYNVKQAVSWVVDPVSRRAKYKSLAITVSWNQGLRQGQVMLTTFVYGKTNLVNAGDYRLTLIDKDSGAPVPSASVTITAQGPDVRNVSTDASGVAFFGYVPAGALSVDVYKYGYNVDESMLQTANIAPDGLTQQTAQAQQWSSVNVYVKHLGAPVQGATVTLQGRTMDTSVKTTPPTDSSGKATFDGLWADTYTATVSMAGGYKTTTGTVTVPRGGVAVDVNISLPGPATLVVTTNENGGGALSNATIVIHGPDSTSTVAPGSPGGDPSGTDTFTGLLPGRYYIDVSAPNHVNATQKFVDLVADQTTATSIGLDKILYGDLLVTVKKTSGGALQTSFRVEVYSPSNKSAYDVTWTTGSSGTFTVTGLPAGTYYLAPLTRTGSTVTAVVVGGTQSSYTVFCN
jgi:hypothetical protein